METRRKISLKHYDPWSMLLYLIIVVSGLILLYGLDTVHTEWHKSTSYLSKQLTWFGLSVVGFALIYFSNVNKVKEWSSLIYLAGILLLAGLFVFGKEVSGAKAWYRIGSIGFQPAEFMKLAVTLGLAKLISERGFDLNKKRDIFKALLLIGVPALLILLQPDLGTVLVFSAFIFVMYREGLSGFYIFPFVWLVLLFFFTVKFGASPVVRTLVVVFLAGALLIYRSAKKHKWNYIGLLFLFLSFSVGAVLFTSYIYNGVLRPHQQKRIALLLGKISDDQGVGYHLKQSLIAISNGNWQGQGFTQGAQLRGNYIPEQHTDYIFTALAEQFGFTGSMIFLSVYLLFIIRLLVLAERQKQAFSRITGYGLAALLSVHLFINVLMVMGLFPVVGIPIVFVSYGGSSLFFFSLLLFLFLKFDANRIDEF